MEFSIYIVGQLECEKCERKTILYKVIRTWRDIRIPEILCAKCIGKVKRQCEMQSKGEKNDND